MKLQSVINPSTIKWRTQFLGLLFSMVSMTAIAGTPHAVTGPVINLDGSTPQDEDIQVMAYVQGRAHQLITQADVGAGFASGHWYLNTGNFGSEWSAGDTLVVDLKNQSTGEVGKLSLVLDNSGTQFASLLNLAVAPPPTQRFGDVPTVYWAFSFVDKLATAGVTSGCTVDLYCPERSVTRAEMAVFLLRATHGSSYVAPAPSGIFSDVATNYWAAAWIEQLAAEGITLGCASGVYCPENEVTRAEMAVFLLRAIHGSAYAPPAAAGVFSDVPVNYWAASWIEQLAAEGVTLGCAAGVFCPDALVTRAEMAVFLVRAFGILTP